MSAKPIMEPFSGGVRWLFPTPLVAAPGGNSGGGQGWRRSVTGEVTLSPRELQCLEALARGLQDSQIAEALSISRPTVRLHLANARRKLKSVTREQALARAVALGLIEP